MAIQTFTAGQVLTAAQMTALQANDYNQTVSAKTTSYTLVAADKGTRITMSNAAATTITVNTSLFAAGDSLRIQNIGAGVCTVTAGTATVTSAGPLAIAQWGGGQLFFTSASAAVWFPDAVNTSLSISIFNETQASGTQGGTATSGSYVKRVLNTTDTNNISGCSLATSVVTLATSGTYYLQGIIPCWRTDGVKARLQNTTAGTTIALGTVGNSNTTDNSQNFATVQGYITTTTSTNIELQGRVTTTAAGSGAGRAVTFGDNEIYAQLFIIKVA
ncbi:hypothetical protein UFOVP1267_13 [uncultured Caudovirales phage]|uniref:Uncharacterized protein n=1 Tax=uncultured Caudovirales phage TaxID=2100421 RepID=A0A6J5RM09_9CAUD|nr:hypothetical protein UFOVP1267_13 [uncultured Caudovirales phage]